MKKTCFLWFICILFNAIVMMPTAAFAEASGKCGDDMVWALDDTGKLTISGSGEMWDFAFDAETGYIPQPWREYMGNIKAVYVGAGITGIGDHAFHDPYQVNAIEKLVVSNSVKAIGRDAFNNCGLQYVILGDGVEAIEEGAFWGAEIDTLYLGENIRHIGQNAFNSNSIFHAMSPGSTVTNLFYAGTREQWNQIDIEEGNSLIGVSDVNPEAKNRVYDLFDGRYQTNIPKSCNLKIGDYVAFGKFGGEPVVFQNYVEAGKFNNEPIVWRVLNINGNQALLFSQDAVMEGKMFDAGGEDEAYHESGTRRETGSNNWRDSSVRQWLNSAEQKVLWTHCPPAETFRSSRDGASWHGNGYDDKPGFLSDNYFTEFERNCIIPTNNFFVDTEDGDYITEDKAFLLSEFEVDFFVDALEDLRLPEGSFVSNYDRYWLRENKRPKYSDWDAWEKGIHSGQEGFVGVAAYSEIAGSQNASSSADIRPAIVIDLSAISFQHGDGTLNRPYTYTKVLLNNAPIAFDQSPIIQDGRTLVPLRAIFEALGATVDWDGGTQTIISTKGEITISMTIGSDKMYKNGGEIPLDVAPGIFNSRTLVPVRAIAESFDCRVDWDGETQTVLITE